LGKGAKCLERGKMPGTFYKSKGNKPKDQRPRGWNSIHILASNKNRQETTAKHVIWVDARKKDLDLAFSPRVKKKR